MMLLDMLDKVLLNALQRGFPLKCEPFAVLGKEMGVEGREMLQRVIALKGDGLIRYIGPLFDARRLGYRSTLAAMRLPESQIEQAARIVGEHAGVSHNYARSHRFNLWFTLTASQGIDLHEEVEELGRRAGAEAVLDLPALRVFKLRTYFDATDDDSNGICSEGQSLLPQAVHLSPVERAVINEVQQDLPLADRPFDPMAERVGMNTPAFLDVCRSLMQRGVMRRFGAAVRHQCVGFTANAMVCWQALEHTVATAGERLASFPQVSHCYERQASPLWPYNLFAMVHARSEDACREVAGRVSVEFGLSECQLLFSTREFKKVRGRYQV